MGPAARKITRPPVCHMLTTSGAVTTVPPMRYWAWEEVAQALVVPCSGSVSTVLPTATEVPVEAQPRPLVHCTRCRPHRVGEGHGSADTRGCHAARRCRAVTHRGHTHSRKAGDCGCTPGPRDAQMGVPQEKKPLELTDTIPESHGTTTLDTHNSPTDIETFSSMPFGHTTSQR